jgi:hypothetical protein
MGCFENLVKSKFLANVSSQLSLARERILTADSAQFPAIHIFNKAEKKLVYDDYVYHYYMIEEIQDSIKENLAKDTLFYIEVDHITFMYSANQSQVKDAIKYSYNVNGLIPLYKGRHRLDGITMYTAMIDTRIHFTPVAPN